MRLISLVTLCLLSQFLQATLLDAYGKKFASGITPHHHDSRRRLDLKTNFSRGGGNARGGASTVAVATATRTLTARQLKTFNLLSGGVAGTVASCITNPLEVIRTQLQSSSASSGELAASGGRPMDICRRIFDSQGVKGFFKGLSPTLVGIIPARSIYFFTYEQTKRRLGKNLLPEGSVGNALIAGFSAGIASNTLTNPIWMVKTRVQLLADQAAGQRAYTGYADVISTILKEEGIGGFYKGITASYWGCAEGAIQFLIYEKVKKRVLVKQNERNEAIGLPPTTRHTKLSLFCTAALAKGVAAALTYPHEVARTRLREQAREGVFRYKGMWQTIGIVAREEGRGGLYAGMGVHMMKVVPNSAIMFLTYEVVNIWLGQFRVKEE